LAVVITLDTILQGTYLTLNEHDDDDDENYTVHFIMIY